MIELLSCPFCGTSHLLGFEKCLDHGWTLVKCRKCGGTGPAGRSETELEAAAYWNRRATQPAAGETVAEFFVDFDTLRKALSIYGLAAPVSNEELGLQMDRQAVRVIEAVARLPFPYPPAAAHEDDTRRIDWLACMWRLGGKLPDVDHGSFREVIDAAMRAQGDGEVQ